MKVTSEKLPDSQVLLNIEVEQETVDKSVERAYRRLANQVAIPGFRRGKAPRHLVERYVGKEALLQEGVEGLIPEVYRQAVAEAGIQPVDQPELDVVQMEPLVIKATVPVEPTVDLGDYQKINLARIEAAVSDQQVDDMLNRMREQNAEWLPIERAVAAGDRVTIDAEAVTGVPSFYSSSGEPMLQLGGGERVLSETGMEIEVDPESKTPLPGFAAELVGITPGQEKRFQLTIPEDFSDKEAAGKNAIVRVVVNSIKEKHLPELDDAFAKTVGAFETLDQLRDGIRESMQRTLEAQVREHFENTIIGIAVDSSRVELPPSMVQRELDRSMQELKSTLSAQNVAMEQYLVVTGRSNEDDLRQQMRPDAERRVRTYFVMNAIGRAEGIEVSPDEISAEIERMVGRAGAEAERARQLLNTPENRESMAMRMWNQKVIDRLGEIAMANAKAAHDEAVQGVSEAEPTADQPDVAESGVAAESGATEAGATEAGASEDSATQASATDAGTTDQSDDESHAESGQ